MDRMQKLGILAGMFLCACAGVLIGQTATRFDRIYTENINAPHGFSEFNVFHDKETGQEIVCVTGGLDGSMSCYLSGRKW